MIYQNPQTGNKITTTPDTVYNKMMVFVSLLPDNTRKWNLTLPWIFFYAMSSIIRDEMQRENFHTSDVSTITKKNSQIQALTAARYAASLENTRISDMKKHVRSQVIQAFLQAWLNKRAPETHIIRNIWNPLPYTPIPLILIHPH